MPSKFKLYFLFASLAVAFTSCRKDDEKITPPRDYSEQYVVDIDSIETYLKTHYITVSEVNGLVDVDIDTLTNSGTQQAIFDDSRLGFVELRNPNRKTNMVDGRIADPVKYKLYYLILNEGGGQRPAVTDSVFCSYRGWTLDNEEFDRSDTPFWSTFPAITAAEISLIPGFREFVPKLRAAESATPNVDGNGNPDGTWTYHNGGSGVVFIPSGLGYFNAQSGSIPAYSPLAFLVRLNVIRERDHDRDKVLSKYENYSTADDLGRVDIFQTDSDGDNIPDFLDIDDDNDTYLTKDEVRITPDTNNYYAFDAIPVCPGGSKKRHLDKSCR